MVADENKERGALYAEIARANDHPEWEADIRATFARVWVEEVAAGTWYQTARWCLGAKIGLLPLQQVNLNKKHQFSRS